MCLAWGACRATHPAGLLRHPAPAGPSSWCMGRRTARRRPSSYRAVFSVRQCRSAHLRFRSRCEPATAPFIGSCALLFTRRSERVHSITASTSPCLVRGSITAASSLGYGVALYNHVVLHPPGSLPVLSLRMTETQGILICTSILSDICGPRCLCPCRRHTRPESVLLTDICKGNSEYLRPPRKTWPGNWTWWRVAHGAWVWAYICDIAVVEFGLLVWSYQRLPS